MGNNDTTSSAGQAAENQAVQYLERAGLSMLVRNYRCRGGEIDIICRDGKVLVFVEVRLRRHAGQQGFIPLPEAMRSRVLAGEVALDEALRVVDLGHRAGEG